jgi:hypothetical protein
VERGLGGRLDTRGPFGGTGNAPMLEVLRREGVGWVVAGVGVFGVGMAVVVSVVLRVGTAGVERALEGFGVGRPDEMVTDRTGRLLAGVALTPEPADPGLAGASSASDAWASDFRVFATGSAGSGPVGGGRAIPEAMLRCSARPVTAAGSRGRVRRPGHS